MNSVLLRNHTILFGPKQAESNSNGSIGFSGYYVLSNRFSPNELSWFAFRCSLQIHLYSKGGRLILLGGVGGQNSSFLYHGKEIQNHLGQNLVRSERYGLVGQYY
jgi:hypothetical protein